MKFYIFDSVTKEYLYSETAYLDPLESEKAGKSIFLQPANSTSLEPLTAKDGYTVNFNGSKWVYIKVEVVNPEEPKTPTFDEVKAQRISELTVISHAFDNQLVNQDMKINSSLGFVANADIRSQNNIQGLIDIYAEPVMYNDFNAVFHELNLEQLKTLKAECIENGQYLYAQKWAYLQKVNACTTIEQLNALEFKFYMKDFS